MLVGHSWESFQNYFQICCAAVSVFLNFILILLIVFKSPMNLGAYRYLMIYISVFEIFYSFMDVIVSPFFHSYGSTFLVMINVKKSGFDAQTALLLGSIYCGCFGASMAIFGVHFIYRYLISTGNPLLSSFNNWKICFWFLTPVVYGTIWGCVAYFPVGQKPATREHIRNNIMSTFDLNVDDTVYIGPYFYQKMDNGQYKIDVESIVGMSIVYFIVSSSFLAIIYFGVKTYKTISELVPMSSISSRSRQLQSQLFYALVTQTTIPIILLHIPVTTVYAFALLDMDLGMLSGIVSITIALFPAIDPLPTILIIRHFRQTLWGYFTGICCCSRRTNIRITIEEPSIHEMSTRETGSRDISTDF